jgi:CRP-like cAMP-binding protein
LVASTDTFPFPLTQEHVGDALGLTAVHVNRTLRGLREDGVLSIHARQLQIHDWKALRRIAGADPDY